MPTRTDLRNQVTVAQPIAASRVADATPVVSTAVNRSVDTPGTRYLLVLAAFETNTANTGGVWTVTESATSAGSYTAATTSTIAATPAEAGNNVQTVDVQPNASKPWLKVTYTGADANAEVDITATLIRVPQAI